MLIERPRAQLNRLYRYMAYAHERWISCGTQADLFDDQESFWHQLWRALDAEGLRLLQAIRNSPQEASDA